MTVEQARIFIGTENNGHVHIREIIHERAETKLTDHARIIDTLQLHSHNPSDYVRWQSREIEHFIVYRVHWNVTDVQLHHFEDHQSAWKARLTTKRCIHYLELFLQFNEMRIT